MVEHNRLGAEFWTASLLKGNAIKGESDGLQLANLQYGKVQGVHMSPNTVHTSQGLRWSVPLYCWLGGKGKKKVT